MKLHIFALLAVFSAVAIADDGGSNNNDRNCEVVGASCRFYGCCKDGACKPDRRGDDGICQLRCEYGGHACDGNILVCKKEINAYGNVVGQCIDLPKPTAAARP
ncbi:unnamed protein product [Zymoseptoria tritici ST99CH_1A5]|uniref:Uncharacterized protein n=2 Tax=Zymoseptoria tritici TaxID=1047171 RepID=A0A1X7RL17_ZYMT9|nr:unnamed protein product [Zymoseptoria tritici ST99CH_3D7]SMR47923.1 unnamed protein product [Zymoseptoria tritici ST99CH_3D1]SMY21829.1 unnamed protein product [Zymoseptoria tritici ST99CH_1A5]